MRRRSFVAMAVTSMGGCLGLGRSTNIENEINHEEGDLEFRGTHDKHEVQFKTIDYSSDSRGDDKLYIDFGEEPPSNIRAYIYLYTKTEAMSTELQITERFSSQDNNAEYILHASDVNMEDYSEYSIAIVEDESQSDNPNIGPQPGQGPRDYCESEDVPKEEDDPMTPNCNENPYG